ncbi:MAG: hypothetical protein MJZ54_05180 [Bacteroidaceae bacterium]|nr:hypothetical protein [Bacteroidaceae bacterium]
MKKTYFSPVTRSIDLSHESDILDLSQAPIIDPDENPDDDVDDPADVMTRRGGIWGWTE